MVAEQVPQVRGTPAVARRVLVPRASLARATRRVSSANWITKYIRLATCTDVAVVACATFTAQWLRFGSDAGSYSFGGTTAVLPVPIVSCILVVAWLAALRIYNSLDHRIIGSGPQEYSRVVTACFSVFGLLAISVLALRLGVSRGYFAIALPLGTVGLLMVRWLWRHRLTRQRREGLNLERVLVIGDVGSTAHLIDRLSGSPELGFEVVGSCLPVTEAATCSTVRAENISVPVYGDFDDVARAVSAAGATTVAITAADALGHRVMQELSWDLQGMEVEMMVSPGVADVAGPRMMVRPVAGLPLLHIDKPRYEGANRLRKMIVDRVGAALIIGMILPVLLLIAIVIKVDSRGPVFYRATRVGLNNQPFKMWKFRSMVTGADTLKADLSGQNEGAGVLFKMRDDPRVTHVGKFIRRYSLDELPQLFNVIGGSMSLVGPRPPLPNEVERYDGRVARRMLVKPGMTGLWQVSGRSDLPWEEAVRLDLSYVENWSIMQDMVILWRTARAVVSKDGAY